MPVEVYQVKVSYEQKPYRKAFIETCGATIYPSPSTKTKYGTSVLKEDPDCPGSLGIAISEAIEACVTSEDAKYSLGSVLSHVLMHQTVIGLEAIDQMKKVGEYPDVIAKSCLERPRSLILDLSPSNHRLFLASRRVSMLMVLVTPRRCHLSSSPLH